MPGTHPRTMRALEQLTDGEPVVARGRDLLVTERRIVTAHGQRLIGRGGRVASVRGRVVVPFELVTGWRRGTRGHRIVMRLSHEPVTRMAEVGRFYLGRHAIGRRVVCIEVGSTTLTFSRDGTEAERAIAEQLRARGVPEGPPLGFEEPSRAERTAGARGYLRRDDA